MAAGHSGAGIGASGGRSSVWKEEEMYRWQIDATSRQRITTHYALRNDLLTKPMQEVRFEFKQSMETGGKQLSWRACGKWNTSSNKMLFAIALQTLNSEGTGSKSLPEKRLALKVENAMGTQIFKGGPCTDGNALGMEIWDNNSSDTYYSWTRINVPEEMFNELQMHGGGMIVTFILKTMKISNVEEILYWPSKINIRRNFHKMITKLENDEEKSDLKIISSDGKEFFAYRWILGNVSEVFEAMFRSDMKEKQSGVLKLDDLNGTTVKTLLHFIYSGEVAKEWSNAETVEELMYAADKYQIEELKKFFDAKLGLICTADNAGVLLAMAEKTSLKKAVADILAFIKEQCNDPKGFFEIVKKTKTE